MNLFEILIVILLTVIAAAVFVVIDGRAVVAWRKRSISPKARAEAGEPTFGILAVGEYKVLDGDGNAKYFHTSSGTGATGDAWIPTHTVSGSVAVTQSGTWDEVGINDSGNSITVDNAQLSVVGSGTEAAAMRVTLATDSTGVLSVDDNGGALTVDGTVTANLAAGTNNIGDVDIISLPASTNTLEVVGDAAHDAAVAGNPLLLGAEAKDQDGAALPNAVSAEGDAVRLAASLSGVLYVMPVTEDGSAAATVNVNSHAVTNAGTFAVQDATAQASLSVLEDWDETDRAKVNLIAGQAGITAGAGAVGASTPRVTLASDDPAVASLATLDNAISGSEMQVDVVAALPAGTNAIGKLAANSGVDIGDVDVTSIVLPLGGGKTVLTAVGAPSSSGDNTVISAPGAGAIYVFGYALQATGTVNGKFTDGAAGTQKTMLWTLQAREGVSRQIAPPGYLFKLSATTALILNLSGAVGMGVEVNYWVE